jgi:hypothetical protein
MENLTSLLNQFESLKKRLITEGTAFRNNKEYRKLQLAIFRSKKKNEIEEAIPPKNVVGLAKIVKKKNLPIIEKKDDSVISAAELPKKIQNNSFPINVEGGSKKFQLGLQNKINSPIIKDNLPLVGKVLTFYEKDLLTHAKIDVAWTRAYAQNKEFTDSEHLAIYKATNQPLTAYDYDLLVFMKLLPVVLTDPLYEGDEPLQNILFGSKEAKLRELNKIKLFFPNRLPTTQETESIRRECEIERAESELAFLKGLLENNPAMKKNVAIAERIAFCTIYIGREKEYLSFHPVPKKPN